jgi:hypothetical protein
MTDAFAFQFVDGIPFRWNSTRVQFIDPWAPAKSTASDRYCHRFVTSLI